MGSIYHIQTNPKAWSAYNSGKKLKEEYGGHELMKICYGVFDDFPGIQDLEMYMRKPVYDKLMSGEYRVSKESHCKRSLIITDKSGNIIEPIKEDFCY